MGEAHLFEHLEFAALPVSERRCGPLTDAVDGEHRGALERRREERAGGVGAVMFRERHAQLAGVGHPGVFELRDELGFDPELVLEPHRDRLGKTPKSTRRGAEARLQDAVKLEDRFVVVRDGVEGRGAGFGEDIAERVGGKRSVVFDAREAFLLGRGDDACAPIFAGLDETRGGVVVARADPYDALIHERPRISRGAPAQLRRLPRRAAASRSRSAHQTGA